MATFAVGDIQGCLQPLQCLLEQVGFNTANDQLWVAGDMVNRGPESLETLRFLKQLGDSAKLVLGNHDLHLLAVAYHVRPPHRKDTLAPILNANDKIELLEWLRHLPLIHHDPEQGFLMVHAGIPPQWSVKKAIKRAAEVSLALREYPRAYLTHMYGNEPHTWDKSLEGWERLRVITNYLTRMRICTAEGQLNLEHKSGLQGIPVGYRPWFDHPERKNLDTSIVFGHWAALEGECAEDNVFALDTGCVWGGKLTMMRLEDQQFFTCSCAQD